MLDMDECEAPMGMSELYYIDVVDNDSEKLEKRIGPHPYGKARKIGEGLSQNLNHDRFHVEFTPEFEVEENESYNTAD